MPTILLNSVPRGAEGLLGDAHDAADVLVFPAHLVENEEEGVVGGIGSVFLLDAVVGAEVYGLVVVDEAFVVVVRPAGGRSSVLDVFIEQLAF